MRARCCPAAVVLASVIVKASLVQDEAVLLQGFRQAHGPGGGIGPPKGMQMDADLALSIETLRRRFPSFGGFPAGCQVIFDIGAYDGADAKAFLQRGYCVVAVDANPAAAARVLKTLAPYGDRALFVNMAVAEKPGNLTFYAPTTGDAPGASLERRAVNGLNGLLKVSVANVTVPGIRCDALWALVGDAPAYVKIDVEERHFVCVEALARVPRGMLPRHVSWEMHDMDGIITGRNPKPGPAAARGLPYPVLDMQLIGLLYGLNYTRMKTSVQHAFQSGAFFSQQRMPEDVQNAMSKSTRWTDVPTALVAGLGKPQPLLEWFDFYMKRDG